MLLPRCFLHAAVLGREAGAGLGVDQAGDHADSARGVQDVDHRLVVGGRDLDGRVRAAGRGAADQQREGEPLALHLASDVRHLVQRRRDQSAQADQVHVFLSRRLQDLLAGDHHA